MIFYDNDDHDPDLDPWSQDNPIEEPDEDGGV